jgi:glutamine amidotransferase
MCRLFGFRSVMQSQVHKSLVSADNALMTQSLRHPDGWGVAYYLGGAPHVIKSVSTAVDDQLFRRVSGVVTSETVLAHLRNATHGEHTILNTHPFQFGSWVFVHNGNIKGFDGLRSELLAEVPPVYRRFILGDTDSELFFYLLLGLMAQHCELDRPGYPIEALADATREAVDLVVARAGPLSERNDGPPTENYLSFVITNGRVMLGHQGGKTLYCSTHKNHCSEREVCPHFANECEQEQARGFVSHLIFSSEPLQGENVWRPLGPREMVGVDWRMQMRRFVA